MISGGIHSGGQSARGRKAYARQEMTVNKNKPLKHPFEKAECSPNILYLSCFQKMQLNPSSLQKHEGHIYGFDNQLVPVEGVITLPIYVGSEPCFMMASVSFLVVKMESAFNAVLGRATLCELKAVISQPHLYEMLGIPAELIVHKLSTDPTKRPVVGFIRRVEYVEWVSNPVLVKKPNGKWRMCIDFTNLNEACPKDPHPLPNVEKLVEQAAGHERMSFLDASSGYHQKLVQIVFKLQIDRNIEVYVDDMIVTSVRAEDHIDDLNETFQNLRRAQMKMNPLKCTFAIESGKFLGYVVSKKEIEIVVYTNLPLKKILQKPELFGRLIRWSVELSEYDLKFQPRTTIKGQAMADFLVECLSATMEEKVPEYPIWVLYVDGAASIEGSGARVVLVGPDGFKSEYALRFKFQTTNNVAEYEALIYGLKLASELKVQSILNSRFASFQLDKTPRADNQRADELSKLAYSQDINPQRSTIVE
ncbi:hypothetical protein SLEP1_g9443, partial [Rubroshorea leprosula]